MNEPSNCTDYYQLAGEYVLGTLQGDERRIFEQEMARDYRLRSEVKAWKNRLTPIFDSIEPIEPPPAVWRKIERSLDRQGGNSIFDLWHSLIFWRSIGMVAATVVLAFTLHLFRQPDTPFDRMMVVTNAQSQPGWVVSSHAKAQALKVTALATSPLPSGRYCQLWMEDAQGRLIPLGVMPHNGSSDMATPSVVLQNTLFKVSVEAVHSAPLHVPSTEIIFEGRMFDI